MWSMKNENRTVTQLSETFLGNKLQGNTEHGNFQGISGIIT